ncbi:DUF2863 family protein [Nitrosomonas sp. ANs5]|uniref:DUF2863 family protein n=1 Tax=Nitrosomonas sp. ANs5 TaxID=3423941 RepID=UPI003D3510EA
MRRSSQKVKYPGASALRELVRVARGLARSSSRIEDAFWEKRLDDVVQSLLAAGDDQTLQLALDRLQDLEPEVYAEILYTIEASVECTKWMAPDQEYDVLLFVMPVLAWSHRQDAIPYGEIPDAIIANLQALLATLVFAKGVRITLANYMLCPQQIQGHYHFLYDLAHQSRPAAVAGQSVMHLEASMPGKTDTLSGIRFVVGAAATPRGGAIFRWQTMRGHARLADKSQADEPEIGGWQTEVDKLLQEFFPGCAVRSVMPDAFFAGARTAAHLIRPFSVYACLDYLMANDIVMDSLTAVIAPVLGEQHHEYRISLIYTKTGEVLHGIIWSLVNDESAGMLVISEIQAILHECGITRMIVLGNMLDLEPASEAEYESSLFPNLEGKMVKTSRMSDFKELSGYLH